MPAEGRGLVRFVNIDTRVLRERRHPDTAARLPLGLDGLRDLLPLACLRL
jgi:hypothetical protein